jgi:hypothetical protein
MVPCQLMAIAVDVDASVVGKFSSIDTSCGTRNMVVNADISRKDNFVFARCNIGLMNSPRECALVAVITPETLVD